MLEKRISGLEEEEVTRLKKSLALKSSLIENLRAVNVKYWKAKRHLDGLSICFCVDDILFTNQK